MAVTPGRLDSQRFIPATSWALDPGQRTALMRGICVLSTLREWLSRRFRRRKARKELKPAADLDLLRVHTQALTKAFQEAEEKLREEIALRIQAEEKARQEAEARLELERVARRMVERGAKPSSRAACRANPEAIAKAQREMMSRVKAEQQALAERGTSLTARQPLPSR